jgi:ADP-ribosylation factor 2-binding protein
MSRPPLFSSSALPVSCSLPPSDVSTPPMGSVEELFGGSEDFTITSDPASQSPDDQYFDLIIGELEDLLLDEAFNDHQKQFLLSHCKQFQLPANYDGDAVTAANTTENQLIHTHIFDLYTSHMEEFITKFLATRVGSAFSMEKFLDLLEQKRTQRGEEEDYYGLSGDVFDLLLSLTEFQQFKILIMEMLAETYKEEKEENGENCEMTGEKKNGGKSKGKQSNLLDLAPTVISLSKRKV